eukprot:CAMPEP_0206193430 /NCGR_PEP_ID=MMETSP0166-20121206/6555_1 /ASSEMBLY_ACC=CAM_ASM_000260 /TAXON_ID=95228 /ORGANISM="Vannella robusta, Strain DIVA3 518/3/11/1/6" /LENGTH=183 /DNA_ID=CAMNT_0053610127 /DNA_START=73 /DNA_END=624 /DNA_ORIENTATION=+
MSINWLEDVEDVSIRSRTVTVTGPRGTLTRSFKTVSADIYGDKKAKKVSIDMWFGSSKQTAVLRTVCTHIKNMMIGVTKGFQYKMKFVYAHFPVNVNISDAKDVIEIRNFLGEKVIRRVPMLEGVTIDRSEVKDEIILESNNVENLGTSASQIQQITKVRNKDIRKFLDGIYVSEKGLVVKDE